MMSYHHACTLCRSSCTTGHVARCCSAIQLPLPYRLNSCWLQMHALPVAAQPTARQQLWVPNMLLVARLFQALPRLTELKLAAPAAVVFAAIRFWCEACSEVYTTPCQLVCSHGERAHQLRAAAAAARLVRDAVPAGQYTGSEVQDMRYLSMRIQHSPCTAASVATSLGWPLATIGSVWVLFLTLTSSASRAARTRSPSPRNTAGQLHSSTALPYAPSPCCPAARSWSG